MSSIVSTDFHYIYYCFLSASSPSFYFHFFFFSNANIGIAHNDEECRCRCEKRKMYIILSVVESKKNNIDIRVAGQNVLSRCVAAPFMPNTNGVVIILISMLDVSRPLLFYVPQSVRQNNCPDLTDCSSISIKHTNSVRIISVVIAKLFPYFSQQHRASKRACNPLSYNWRNTHSLFSPSLSVCC